MDDDQIGVVAFDFEFVPGERGRPPQQAFERRDAARSGIAERREGQRRLEQDEPADICIDFARTLGVAVVSVDYRLSPENPAPSSLDDCYAGLAWVFREATARGFDTSRVAVGGASAGGGLAAGVTLMVHDRGEFTTVFQLLVYPMLDDRTALRSAVETRGMRVWMPASNEYAWRSYLGSAFGTDAVSSYAAPARRADLTGLPPAWIGVGDLDLFHDEDLDYARRLTDAGVPCETVVVPGAFHGFDIFFRTRPVTREFWRSQARALQRAFHPDLDESARL
ncbi:hypothetical protein nbrc107696_33820 [Gordonia spumicola]|uniref:Alpha/beta hydrolase fold-3 domain-containing protein n=1 Tax=Gordonia spumicola TaxID=589161 RepID=A0A7I9VC33_9ACTN|nr:alpha/beta hydrolase [Gordonia spumicola]GEE02936.1 hypothetical protein nbrc107696_33820 [Gordonia spumicola]